MKTFNRFEDAVKIKKTALEVKSLKEQSKGIIFNSVIKKSEEFPC